MRKAPTPGRPSHSPNEGKGRRRWRFCAAPAIRYEPDDESTDRSLLRHKLETSQPRRRHRTQDIGLGDTSAVQNLLSSTPRAKILAPRRYSRTTIPPAPLSIE